MNACLQELLRLDPRNRRTDWCEDIQVRIGNRVGHFSVQVEHKLDIDGNVVAERILYDGKPVTLIPVIADLIEQTLQDELP
jgi:hypothetical protein